MTAALTARHREAAALERSLAADLAAIISSSVGSNGDDEHDPDGATIAFERAQAQAVLDQARERLAELSEALARVRAGEYGSCLTCGALIGPERLAARPGARTCIRCAR